MKPVGRRSQSLKLNLSNPETQKHKYNYTLNISEDLLKIILKDKLKHLGESFILEREDQIIKTIRDNCRSLWITYLWKNAYDTAETQQDM